MPQPTATPPKEPDHRSVTELVFDVSEKTSSLIREEIELAKAEVTEKVGKILRGSAVGAAAGAFAFLASLLMTIIPSRQASSIPIAEALRYE